MSQWEYCYIYSSPTIITYNICRTDNIYTTETQPFSTESLGYCLSTLGLLGWEAINIAHGPGEEVTWYFKRAIHPNNQPLTFP